MNDAVSVKKQLKSATGKAHRKHSAKPQPNGHIFKSDP